MPVPERFILMIPAHNEQDRLPPTLVQFAEYARAHYGGDFTLLVVLNGCSDNTLGVTLQAEATYPCIRHIDLPGRIGKGGALIEGLRHALDLGCDLVGFIDADGSTPPASLFSLVRRAPEADCIVGSRRVAGAVIKQFQPSHRQLASRIFHAIVASLFQLGIQDTQCGAKVMKAAAARRILPMLHIADMAFDVNLLYALKRCGCSLLEAPVEWTDHLGSKVRYFRTSLVMFLSVARLRLVYSPFHRLLRPLRPLEAWIYHSLRNPPPRENSRPDRA